MGYVCGTGCPITPDKCKQVRILSGGGGDTISGTQQGQTSGSGGPIKY